MTNGHYVIPKLVEDASLKRARTEIEIGGETKDAIRVTSVGGSSGTDLSPVTDILGDVNGGTWFPIDPGHATLLDIQRGISKALMFPTGSPTVYTLLDDLDNNKMSDLVNNSDYIKSSTDDINDSTADIKTFTGSAAEALGTKSDSVWDGSADGTLVAIEKRTSNVMNSVSNNVSSVNSKLGTTAESAWSGTGNGSLIAVEKRTSLATGTQSDTAWDGQTANATIIALLKGIYNKL